MDGTLSLVNKALAYADDPATSNPQRRYVDWSVQRKYAVANPRTIPFTVDPGATLQLFSGTRATSTDATTQLTLTLSALASNRYRFTFSAGTDPVFRTNRAITVAGRNITVTVNANNTVTVASLAGDFTAVVVGDTVLIPDTTTGDAASPFDPLNVGYWSVLSVAGNGSSMQLARPSGVAFTGKSEVVAVASATQFLTYSAAGVQVGDSVNISAGFSAPVIGSYQIIAVTSKWFEILSTAALPTGVSALPGVAGIQFYTQAKRYVRFEADQPCVLRLNGDTGNSNQLTPWTAADADNTAFFEKVGTCWDATVVNSSSMQLNLLFISCE